MKLLHSFIILGSLVLIGLPACSNNQATNSNNSPIASSPTLVAQPTTTQTNSSHQGGTPQKGGQVIESGAYHLEFVPIKESKGTHLDFYLQKGDTHTAIPNAKVTAQVQLPDGTQKTLPLTYDALGKHYTAMLLATTPGEHKIAILSNINGKKVNGRFTFNR